MCSSEFNLQGTNMPIQHINRALKQLEFLQSLPNQKGVVETIAESLKPNFRLNIYVLPYFNQLQLLYIADWNCPQFLENYKYEQGNSSNHKTTAGGYQWRYLKQEYLSPIKKNANLLKIAITQLSKEGLVLREWESGAAIAEHFNMVNASSIYAVCKGKSKSAKGFLWKYSSEIVKGEVNEINT